MYRGPGTEYLRISSGSRIVSGRAFFPLTGVAVLSITHCLRNLASPLRPRCGRLRRFCFPPPDCMSCFLFSPRRSRQPLSCPRPFPPSPTRESSFKLFRRLLPSNPCRRRRHPTGDESLAQHASRRHRVASARGGSDQGFRQTHCRTTYHQAG